MSDIEIAVEARLNEFASRNNIASQLSKITIEELRKQIDKLKNSEDECPSRIRETPDLNEVYNCLEEIYPIIMKYRPSKLFMEILLDKIKSDVEELSYLVELPL